MLLTGKAEVFGEGKVPSPLWSPCILRRLHWVGTQAWGLRRRWPVTRVVTQPSRFRFLIKEI